MSAEIDGGEAGGGGGDETAPVTTGVPITKSTSGMGNWRDSLSVDLRNNPTLASLDSVEALANEHVNVQKLIGAEKIGRPQEDWTDDQYSDFYTKLGRPALVEDYELGDVERPGELPWSDDVQDTMLSVMHKAGLSTSQVQQVLKGYIDSQSSEFTQGMSNAQTARDNGIQDLRNEWGKSYDSQVDLATRAFRAGAGEGFEDVAGLTLADGGMLGDHPLVIKAFAALGGQMNEHGIIGGKTPRSALSPEEAKTQRLQLISDPEFRKSYYDASHIEHELSVKRINDLTIAEVGDE